MAHAPRWAGYLIPEAAHGGPFGFKQGLEHLVLGRIPEAAHGGRLGFKQGLERLLEAGVG